MMTMTLHKQYKNLAHLIIEKAKRMGKMKRYDYKHYVKPFATMLRMKTITEKQLLSGLRRANIMIVK